MSVPSISIYYYIIVANYVGVLTVPYGADPIQRTAANENVKTHSCDNLNLVQSSETSSS